jgi:Bacterial transcriptional activator domain
VGTAPSCLVEEVWNGSPPALLVYERCRARLADDLGTSPGAAIQALHLDLLRER